MSRAKDNNMKREGEREREAQRAERFMQAMAGQTFAEIAEAVSAAASTIHNYASGKIPSADMGIKIAKYLGVDLDWWINGNGSTSAAAPSVVYLPVRGQQGAISYSSGLIDLLNRNVESLFCTFGVGTMMHPTIPKDSELVCSTDIQPIKDGCVYLVQLGAHEVIRRLRIKPHGIIEARCDNPQVQLEKPDEISSDNILAEVLWVSHAPQG